MPRAKKKERAQVLNIGENIKKARLEKKNSRERLSRKIGISGMQIYRIERGEQGCKAELAFRFAEALTIPAFKLFMTEKERKEWEEICQESGR